MHFPPLEDAPVSLASLARKRVGCDSVCEGSYEKIELKKNITKLLHIIILFPFIMPTIMILGSITRMLMLTPPF